MNILYILIAGISATSLMTLFSYIVSYINRSEFKEPELLNASLSSSKIFPIKVAKNKLAGWAIHYFIGLLFVAGFNLIWKFTPLSPSVFTGIVLGFIAGTIGIPGWTVFLS